ncbi:MAG: cytochrome P450 [Myxococcales bacterium]|nr:cytochrome P450 [Myxococcales bacterium]
MVPPPAPDSAVAYDPFAREIFDDPHPIYRRLRAESPVHHVERFDCWALSTFEDVWDACQSPDLYTAEQGTTAAHVLQKVVEVFPALDMMDPPRHTAHRALVSGIFLPGKVKKFEKDFRKIVRDRLERVRATGRLDVVKELGSHLSTLSICRVLNFPEADGEMLRAWVEDVFHREPGALGITQAGVEAFAKLDAYFLELVRTRRRTGGRSGRDQGDVLGRYMAAEVDGGRMSDEKIASLLKELMIAGTETIPKMLAATLHRLWERPDARREVQGRSELMLEAFMETVRFDMPTQFMARVLKEDVELRGHKLRAGQPVLLLYASASRDEHEFPDADEWDLHRRAPRTIGFGHGTHACLGRHVARLEARVALEEILSAMPEYEVDVAASERLYTEYVQGFASLPIVFEPY